MRKQEEKELLEIERQYCDRLIDFTERAWPVIEPGTKFLRNWCLDAIGEHCEAVLSGEISKLLVTVPPGTAKSTIISVSLPAYIWGPRGMPSKRILSASFERVNAIRDNRKTRQIIESEWYQSLWRLALTTDQNEKSYFENEKRGFRQCAAVASTTGKRGDLILLDDPLSVEQSKSRMHTEVANRIFRQTLPTRLNSPESAIIAIMQRLGCNDVAAQAIELGYVHLMLPMEYQAKRKCVTCIGFEDPRTEEGELLFPERFPRETVEELKRALGSEAYSAQQQQDPVLEGGAVIKVQFLTENQYEELPDLQFREIHSDTAMKTKEHNDYSVFQCWGLCRKGHVYLIDQIRGKWEAPELLKMSAAFAIKHLMLEHDLYDKRYIERYGRLRMLGVEDASSGTGLIQSLKRMISVPVVPIKVMKDRYTRVYSILPKIEQGMVHLWENAPYMADFLQECEHYTADDSHIHDDQIDPMVMAINSMIDERKVPWWQYD